MIFAGIDVNIITHEKALAAGVEALGLWTWGMCYAQLHETNGRLARVAVLTALGGRRNVMLAKRLVDAGLWEVADDGSWAIWNYGKKNQTAEEIRAKKEASAARVQRWRERRNAPGNANVTPDVTHPERVRTQPPPEPSPEPDNTTRKQDPLIGRDRPSEPKARRPMAPVIEPITSGSRVLGLDGEGGAAWQAWRDGVTRATGGAVSELGRWEKPELVAFVNAHAGGLQGELLMAWIAKTAEAFARAHADDGYGLTTKRCKVWLDGGRKAPRAHAGSGTNGIVQSAVNRAWKAPENF